MDTPDLAASAYAELRALAAHYLASENGPITLRATGLAHEAYLRLAGQERARFRGREHFLAVAAQVMRRILVDGARRRAAHRAGPLNLDVAVDDGEAALPGDVDLLELDRALTRLAERDARKARVVELRFFAGLPLDAIGAELSIAPRTVREDWSFARAWLHRELVQDA